MNPLSAARKGFAELSGELVTIDRHEIAVKRRQVGNARHGVRGRAVSELDLSLNGTRGKARSEA